MRRETKRWMLRMYQIFPDADFDPQRRAIYKQIIRAEIKISYHKMLNDRAGESAKIKRELADRYNISVKTVEKYIYNLQ